MVNQLSTPNETAWCLSCPVVDGEKDKRYLVVDSGHVPPRNDIIRETLDWLGHYLGPTR